MNRRAFISAALVTSAISLLPLAETMAKRNPENLAEWQRHHGKYYVILHLKLIADNHIYHWARSVHANSYDFEAEHNMVEEILAEVKQAFPHYHDAAETASWELYLE